MLDDVPCEQIGRDSNAPKYDLFESPMQKLHWKMIQNQQMSAHDVKVVDILEINM